MRRKEGKKKEKKSEAANRTVLYDFNSKQLEKNEDLNLLSLSRLSQAKCNGKKKKFRYRQSTTMDCKLRLYPDVPRWTVQGIYFSF